MSHFRGGAPHRHLFIQRLVRAQCMVTGLLSQHHLTSLRDFSLIGRDFGLCVRQAHCNTRRCDTDGCWGTSRAQQGRTPQANGRCPSLSRQESGCTPARASAFTSPTPERELQHHPPVTRRASGRREPRAREDRDEGLHVVLPLDLAAVPHACY